MYFEVNNTPLLTAISTEWFRSTAELIVDIMFW